MPLERFPTTFPHLNKTKHFQIENTVMSTFNVNIEVPQAAGHPEVLGNLGYTPCSIRNDLQLRLFRCMVTLF